MGYWYEEAVFYHIYPLGLTGAPRENHNEAGNGFEKLKLWIPHMKKMGFTALYIGPLFESSTHGYDTKDYRTVDIRLGKNEDFKEFVTLCHEAGIHVVVDGVFNHTGREFFAFKDIQINRENSRYKDWYKGINFWGNTHYNDGFGYEAWRNCFELVNLNLWNREVKDYLFDVIRFWIDEFNIDGIRLDCADCLDFDFMKEMRFITTQKKEDFWLMGEVIHGDYSRWANADMLHSVTNYELHKGLYSGHNDYNYFEIAHTVRRLSDDNGGICKGRKLYGFTDNHDVERLISKLTRKEDYYPVQMLLYTLPGIPSIYYGSEWGIEGRKANGDDGPLRPEIDITKQEDNLYSNYIAKLGRIHKENPELSYGRYKELVLKNRQYAFGRFLDNSMVLTAVNNDDIEAEVVVNIGFQKAKAKDLFTDKEIVVGTDGKISLVLPPHRGCIVRAERE
ncbi:MAG: alpha-amylase [Lachnospiraceae bacterium]|nr:alpha-amylase [Lachnospiraceae bacterium]